MMATRKMNSVQAVFKHGAFNKSRAQQGALKTEMTRAKETTSQR
jgi:hypothetical protein